MLNFYFFLPINWDLCGFLICPRQHAPLSQSVYPHEPIINSESPWCTPCVWVALTFRSCNDVSAFLGGFFAPRPSLKLSRKRGKFRQRQSVRWTTFMTYKAIKRLLSLWNEPNQLPISHLICNFTLRCTRVNANIYSDVRRGWGELVRCLSCCPRRVNRTQPPNAGFYHCGGPRWQFSNRERA